MEFLLHSVGAISCSGAIFNVLRRNRYLKKENYGLTIIPAKTKIIHIVDKNDKQSSLLSFYPFPIIVPLHNNKMDSSYLGFFNNNKIIEYNRMYTLDDKFRFTDFTFSENTVACCNGEIEFNAFCDNNNVKKNNISVGFPVICYTKILNNDHYLYADTRFINPRIKLYNDKTTYDNIFWAVYIQTFINMFIFYLFCCVVFYKYYKKNN